MPKSQQRGGVYAGFWKGGLWYSSDFGTHWQRVRAGEPLGLNAVAMDKSGQTLVLASCRHVYSDKPTALWLSQDNGRTWTDMYDTTLGALRIIDVALDVSRRRVYVVTCGNGAYYFDY